MAQLPKSKWMTGAAPVDPVSHVARQALDQRLRLVWHYLPLAAEQAEENVEYVHQLRVASRRAAASLELFRDLLPKKRSKWMQRKLRRARSAAGGARDLDVLALRLGGSTTGDRNEALRDLLDEIARQRVLAQDPIKEAYQIFTKRRFELRIGRLVKRIRWRGEGPEPNLAQAARVALSPIGEDFFQAGAADMNQAENLHRLRISAKNLRYAMELLVGAFDSTLRKDLYPLVEDIQQRLGVINDQVTATRQYRCWKENLPEKPADLLGQLITREDAPFCRDTRAFRQWWTPELRRDFRQRLHALLTNGC